VRKEGGRNTNNDRYVYVNADDHPQPLAELRRLLDLNLSYLYEDAADRLFEKGDKKGALEAARKAARYAPGHADTHLVLGLFEYVNGNQETALADDKEFLAKLGKPAATPPPSAVSASEKERELLFRGLQYAEAIRVFHNRFQRFPLRLEELITAQPRSIRRLWKDPMSDDGAWSVILADPDRPERGIRGVRSTSPQTSTLAIADRRRYSDWEFVGLPGSLSAPKALQDLSRLADESGATARRSEEAELRAALRELRDAIDEYKRVSDRGLIPIDLGTDGYPKTLELLVDGVERTDAKGQTLTFLRQIPTDPMTGRAEWGLRSYQNRPGATSWGEEDVFDVYSLSTALGSDGRPYREW